MKLYFNKGTYLLIKDDKWLIWNVWLQKHDPTPTWAPCGTTEFAVLTKRTVPFITDWAPITPPFDDPSPFYEVPPIHFLLLTGLDFYRTVEEGFKHYGHVGE